MSSRGGRRQSLSNRLMTYFGVAYLIVIALMSLAVDRSARATLVERSDDAIEVAGTLARASLPDSSSEYDDWAAEMFSRSGYRTALIRSDGEVLADSHLDPSGMENHADRPEVIAALAGRVGTDERQSASTGFEQRYVALPVEDDLIVRMSLPTRVLSEELGGIRASIGFTAVVIGLLGVGVMFILARRLAQPITELTVQAAAVAEGDLGVNPRRSSVDELDQLGIAISAVAERLGGRLAEARTATETMEAVLGGLSNGTVLIDRDDRIEYANPAAKKILGPIPENVSQLAPLQLQAAVRDARSFSRQDTRILEHGVVPPRTLRVVARPLENGRVLLLIIDLTERDRVDSVRRDFVANASHELKTPVATIIASADALTLALEREEESPERFARRIAESAQQLDRLVSDLLDLSRVERDSPELSPARLDQLVRAQVDAIRTDAETRGLELVVTMEQVIAWVNSRDISVAVRNLLQNAVRYTERGGSIHVSVSATGGRANVSVSDTGEGIPSRDLARVFERFYRVDSARSRQTGGTGLGLAITKHVTESHGGSIHVESRLGVGSTFRIELPVEPSGEAPTAN